MKKVVINNVIFFLCTLTFFGGCVEFVLADAWWGKGYRSPEWVTSHGGTIINYTIVGANSPKKYKAMMFRNGEYVEVEFGNNATFDDAKNGTYVINFYKCKKSCMDHKNDKKKKIRSKDKLITSITIVARPGQTNNVVFDAAAGRAFIASRRGGYVPVDPFVAQKKRAEEQEGFHYIYVDAKQKDHVFDQLTYLSPNIDFARFKEQNVAAGIVLDYSKPQES